MYQLYLKIDELRIGDFIINLGIVEDVEHLPNGYSIVFFTANNDIKVPNDTTYVVIRS